MKKVFLFAVLMALCATSFIACYDDDTAELENNYEQFNTDGDDDGTPPKKKKPPVGG